MGDQGLSVQKCKQERRIRRDEQRIGSHYLGGGCNRNQISCHAARCGAAPDPFDHFEIHANSNLKVLTRISKWSNGPRAASHRVARKWIRVRCNKLVFHGKEWKLPQTNYFSFLSYILLVCRPFWLPSANCAKPFNTDANCLTFH
jgi:hypothetical protein